MMAITRDAELSLVLVAVDELAAACQRAGITLHSGNVPGLAYVRHAAERARKGERPDPAQPYSPKPKPKITWREPTTNAQIDGYARPAPEREPLVQPGTNHWADLVQEQHAAEQRAAASKKPLGWRLREKVK